MVEGVCPVCGAQVDTDQRECDRCGFKLVGSTESFSPVSPEPGELTGPPVVVEGMAFVVVKGPQVGEVFYFEGDSLTIGRDPKCDIFLSDMTVSREHAVVTVSKDAITVRDLGSLNGTWVDGKLVEESQLKIGSVVQIGVFSMVLMRESET